MLVGDIPRLNARRYGDKAAVIQGDRTLSWRAVDERSDRVANLLRASGLRIGDRVAVLAPNVLEWPEISFGISKAGLVLVPVNVRLAVPELEFLVEDSGARGLIFETSLAAVADKLLHNGDFAAALEIGGSEVAPAYDTALQHAAVGRPDSGSVSPDDLRALVYTSGTTGLPKAVINTHRTMLSGAIDHVQTVGMRSDDRGLAVTPFFTSGGTMRTISWAYLGGSMVVLPRFDEEQIVDHIQRYGITTTILVPTMLARMCEYLESSPGASFPSLRHIGYGSAPSTPALIRRVVDAFGCDLWQRYGQSEVAGFVTYLSPDDHRQIMEGHESFASSAGKESAYAEITIRDEEGREVPDGTIGELVIDCDANNAGYWNRPDVTAERFRGRSLYTGDIAFRDPGGYLHLVDRKNDLIISGAFNIYPGELERVVSEHAGVHQVAVFGIPHAQWGETPVVAVIPRSDWSTGTARLETELQALCRSSLAGYKQPNRFVFLKAFPVSAAGKVLKSQLKKTVTGQEAR